MKVITTWPTIMLVCNTKIILLPLEQKILTAYGLQYLPLNTILVSASNSTSVSLIVRVWSLIFETNLKLFYA